MKPTAQKKNNYLQPLSKMERVEQSVISEKLDEFLERIDKENIGIVITENGKDKYVLCPYWWFDKDFDDDLRYVISSAVRHELTEGSDNTDAVQRFIRNHYKSLDYDCLAAVEKEIEHYYKCGGSTDEWCDIHSLLKSEKERRCEKKEP